MNSKKKRRTLIPIDLEDLAEAMFALAGGKMMERKWAKRKGNIKP